MKGIINTSFCTGMAKISDQLHIHMADKGFYSFINREDMESVRDIVVPDDIPEIYSAIEALSTEAESQALFRVISGDGDISWVIGRFKRDDKQMYGSKLINVYFTEFNGLAEQVEHLESRVDTLLTYLDLMNAILLSYDVDKDELKVFTSEKKHTFFYSGSLDKFIADKTESMEICESHRDVFEELILDFKNGVEEFRIGFKVKFDQEDADYKWCEVYGKTTGGKVLAKVTVKNDSREEVGPDTATFKNTVDFGTGLANKATIVSYARSLIESKPDHNVALAIIDLDNFKYINDTYGHKFGDEVLAKTASIIKEALGERGMAGRIGGDEMFVVFDEVDNEAELRGLLRTIRTNVEWSYKGIKDELEVSCSIGAAVYPIASGNYDELFVIADKMLYLAKEKGRNRYVMYTPDIHKQYVEGKIQTTITENDRARYNKCGEVCTVIERIHKHEDILEPAYLNRICSCFELEEISFVSATDYKTLGGVSFVGSMQMEHPYLGEEGYGDLFDENNVCVFNSITYVNKWSECAFEVFKKGKVSAIIQYRYMDNGETKGYINFAKSKFSKKWTEMDISLLTLLGKSLGMYLSDEKNGKNKLF